MSDAVLFLLAAAAIIIIGVGVVALIGRRARRPAPPDQLRRNLRGLNARESYNPPSGISRVLPDEPSTERRD